MDGPNLFYRRIWSSEEWQSWLEEGLIWRIRFHPQMQFLECSLFSHHSLIEKSKK